MCGRGGASTTLFLQIHDTAACIETLYNAVLDERPLGGVFAYIPIALSVVVCYVVYCDQTMQDRYIDRSRIGMLDGISIGTIFDPIGPP